MTVAVIKYNAGNVQSVLYSLKRLGVDALVTDDPHEIRQADRVIFPGVGNAFSAMEYVREKRLDELIVSLTQPVLGICLGLQLLCQFSDEGATTCLGIFDTSVKKFELSASGEKGNLPLKIPHMGWNQISGLSSVLFEGIEEASYMYFVHSYYAQLSPQTIASTHYLNEFSAALHKDNFFGVQFHVEKSAGAGERILSNFLNMNQWK